MTNCWSRRAESGADGGADGDLAAARFGARQQQVGHVDAGDQQHEADRAQQHQHGAADAFDDLVLEAGEHDRVVLGIEGVVGGAQRVGGLLRVAHHFRLRLGDRRRPASAGPAG